MSKHEHFWSLGVILLTSLIAMTGPRAFAAGACGHACLERIGRAYMNAYLHHDPKLAPIAANVRYTEDNVPLRLPDGTWETVTREVGPEVRISDPQTGEVGIFTSIMQRKLPGYLAVRLKVEHGLITQIEQVVATRRQVGMGPFQKDLDKYAADPILSVLEAPLKPGTGTSRAEMVKLANGYYDTVQLDNGEIHTQFRPDCNRIENGMVTTSGRFGAPGCAAQLKLGFYHWDDRLRGRRFFLVDRKRGVVMGSVFIDHRGVLGKYKWTDGSVHNSPMQEPQTWYVLEAWKVRNGEIGPIIADFINVPYYMKSPWEGGAGFTKRK
jgi:hypothetical protein